MTEVLAEDGLERCRLAWIPAPVACRGLRARCCTSYAGSFKVSTEKLNEGVGERYLRARVRAMPGSLFPLGDKGGG